MSGSNITTERRSSDAEQLSSQLSSVPEDVEAQRSVTEIEAKVYGPYLEDVNALRDELMAISKKGPARWQSHMHAFTRMFKDGFQCARIHTIEGSKLGVGVSSYDATIAYYTKQDYHEAEMAEQLFKGPYVVTDNFQTYKTRDEIEERSKIAIANFIDYLGDVLLSDERVEIQDFVVDKRPTKPLTIQKLRERFRSTDRKLDSTKAGHPINCLNLKGGLVRGEPDWPDFLRQHRFSLIDILRTRLEQKLRRTAGQPRTGVGKHWYATKLEGEVVDLAACETFTLLAQRGAQSGCHTDVLNGTFVRCIAGIKAWFIYTGPITDEVRADFSSHGDTWVPNDPKDMHLVLLTPGDTLIMPPGTICIHAPLTVTDCLMTGGMFWDREAVLDIGRNIRWCATNPTVTNEAIPRQFPFMWDLLEEDVMQNTEKYCREDRQTFRHDFKNLCRQLREAIGCQCEAGHCIPGICRCTISQAHKGICGVWCQCDCSEAHFSSSVATTRSPSNSSGTSTSTKNKRKRRQESQAIGATSAAPSEPAPQKRTKREPSPPVSFHLLDDVVPSVEEDCDPAVLRAAALGLRRRS